MPLKNGLNNSYITYFLQYSRLKNEIFLILNKRYKIFNILNKITTNNCEALMCPSEKRIEWNNWYISWWYSRLKNEIFFILNKR